MARYFLNRRITWAWTRIARRCFWGFAITIPSTSCRCWWGASSCPWLWSCGTRYATCSVGTPCRPGPIHCNWILEMEFLRIKFRLLTITIAYIQMTLRYSSYSRAAKDASIYISSCSVSSLNSWSDFNSLHSLLTKLNVSHDESIKHWPPHSTFVL